jgi:7,8-dihydropterin-6-yl-methyl-4-(beta-D-ribofuranosyl)aminobenzene 5'-phosphate synthase
VKIVTLIENLVYSPGLSAEHGLSMYLETENRKILFDTGQSGLFLDNAGKLGIDISEIDTVILSHGHYDHTGGLYPFLKVNNKAQVFCKESLFEEKYHGKNRFIGTPYHQEIIGNRITYLHEITEIDTNLYIVPDIEIFNTVDTHFKNMQVKKGDSWTEDSFRDELFLAYKIRGNQHILTACSHRGITNICRTAEKALAIPVKSIIGGFHLKDSTIEQYIEITWYLRQNNLETLGVCHCTGIDKFAEMKSECDIKVYYNFTGNEINLK